MADQALGGIDQSMADSAARRRTSPLRASRMASAPIASPASVVDTDGPDEGAESGGRDVLDRVVIASLAVQFLSAGVLFVPGAQPLRAYIRALPYFAALIPLAYYITRHVRGWRPAGALALIGALFVLTLNLLHPSTQLVSGVAQCIFQLAIAAPAFWMSRAIRSKTQFQWMLTLIFLMNFASAGLGILQVYDPDRFLPSQFSAQLREDYLGSLTYLGSDGRVITRPPGLSDVPGGAAVAGGVTAMLGLGLALRAAGPWQTLGSLTAMAVGVAVIYLTQVRSVFLMVIAAAAVLILVAFKMGRLARAGWLLVGGSAIIVTTFLWASSLGGNTVNERFLNIGQQGAVGVFQQNRGSFLDETLGTLLNEYPFGAGVGRWGMMNSSFADQNAFGSTPIHVEIQLTGWLLDGGIPMWLLYGGAIVLSIVAAFRLTASRDPALADLAVIALGLQVFIAGLAMAGPIFNTQMGILFWSCAASLQGAAIASQRRSA